MSQIRFFLTLISPSLLSGAVVIIISLLILSVHAWQTIHENQLFYEYLFGPFGFITSGLNQSEKGLFTEVLQSDLTYKIVVGVIAIIAGFIAYVSISGIQRGANEGRALWQVIRTHGHFNQTYRRISLSFIALLCWAVYIYCSLILLVPFCISLLEIGVTTIALADPSGWLGCVGALLLLMLTLHMHIIFARLFMLRLRLFDTTTAQLLDLEK